MGRTPGYIALCLLPAIRPGAPRAAEAPVDPQGADYQRGELAAQATRDGLFKGSLLPPWEWRAGKREIAPGPPWRGPA